MLKGITPAIWKTAMISAHNIRTISLFEILLVSPIIGVIHWVGKILSWYLGLAGWIVGIPVVASCVYLIILTLFRWSDYEYWYPNCIRCGSSKYTTNRNVKPLFILTCICGSMYELKDNTFYLLSQYGDRQAIYYRPDDRHRWNRIVEGNACKYVPEKSISNMQIMVRTRHFIKETIALLRRPSDEEAILSLFYVTFILTTTYWIGAIFATYIDKGWVLGVPIGYISSIAVAKRAAKYILNDYSPPRCIVCGASDYKLDLKPGPYYVHRCTCGALYELAQNTFYLLADDKNKIAVYKRRNYHHSWVVVEKKRQ